jgi:hypothetical protein
VKRVVVVIAARWFVCQSKVAVAEAQGQFRNPEEGERQPLETVTRRLEKTVTEDISVCVCVCVCNSDM